MATQGNVEDIFPVIPGKTILNGRYKPLRKLGSGVFSETWLVEDEKLEVGRYLAAKILTKDGTSRHDSGETRELAFLKRIAECDEIEALPVLRDDFVTAGPRGDHLCLVMDPLSSDVGSLRRQSPTKSLPPYFVKNIIACVLEGLVQLHGLGIIHTDIKPDNILFGGVDDERIQRELTRQSPVTDGEFELDGEKYPVCATQPIPHPFTWDASRHDAEVIILKLVDLGQAQWAGKQPTVDEFSAPSLRAPEIILQSSFGPKIDIWAIGCITFELLTGRWLFDPEDGGEDWSIEDDHLAKMAELTGEEYTPEVLQHARKREHYFDDSGKLRRIDEIFPGSIESVLGSYNILDKEEVKPAAEFISSCLHLNPFERPSAPELQLAPWLRDAFTC